MQSTLENTKEMDIANVLAKAERLSINGEREKAYKLSLQATQKAPQEIQAWLLRADTAASLEEKLVCLSRLYAIDPNCYPAKTKMYQALNELLQKEPYLDYIDETENLYKVRSGLELYLNVPKARAVPEPFPAPKPAGLSTLNRWLILSLFGLLFGGILALFLAPVVIIKAFLFQFQPLNRRDQIRSLILLVIAVLTWLAALPIGFLFILHFS